MSTYYPNIPASGDKPSDSQPLILSNFQAINNAISRNHTAMTDTANSGKHQFLQMPEQGAAPATAVNEGGLYTKPVSGATQLFFREENNGSERQLTAAYTAATNGNVIIPGGLMIQWGYKAGLSNGSTVLFAPAFSIAPYNVQVTIQQDSTASNAVYVKSTGIDATKFTIATSAGSIAIYWTAIGLA